MVHVLGSFPVAIYVIGMTRNDEHSPIHFQKYVHTPPYKHSYTFLNYIPLGSSGRIFLAFSTETNKSVFKSVSNR